MSKPRFEFRNLVKSTKPGKVRAFFDLRIPTESIGVIDLAGFKVVEGARGMFISLPNRAVKKEGRKIVNTSGGPVEGTVEEVKYFNNIRFENQEKYEEFRKELNDNVLPLITEQLRY